MIELTTSEAFSIADKPNIKSSSSTSRLADCQVPCDYVSRRSWRLFRARELLHGVIAFFKHKQTIHYETLPLPVQRYLHMALPDRQKPMRLAHF